jgi:hypothetical protein
MRRFVPGVDSHRGTGIPASLMRASEPEPEPDSDHAASRHPSAVDYVALIAEPATTLIEKYRKLCYWRQVVNAENN